MRGRTFLLAFALTLAVTAAALVFLAGGAGTVQSSGSALGIEVSATRLRAVEGGTAASYTLRPSADPGQALTISISNPDATAFTLSPATLSFTSGVSGNWNVPKQVTITPLQDADAEHEVVALTHSASGIETIDVKVYMADDEAADPPPFPTTPADTMARLPSHRYPWSR